MTNALYDRIEAIERFAADVAHELKNPLTSLRSAVETLPRAKTEEAKARLTAIIQHDVRRLDRLISDISNASRLDAELARDDAVPVDIASSCKRSSAWPAMSATTMRQRSPSTSPRARRAAMSSSAMTAVSRQVFNNLIDNALSFCRPGGTVAVTARRIPGGVEVTVDDDGPGIRPDQAERIFERFYTDRPDRESFGQNSGLGLSISKQIVEAHHGAIWAENRTAPDTGHGVEPLVLGARFTVQLPTP